MCLSFRLKVQLEYKTKTTPIILTYNIVIKLKSILIF